MTQTEALQKIQQLGVPSFETRILTLSASIASAAIGRLFGNVQSGFQDSCLVSSAHTGFTGIANFFCVAASNFTPSAAALLIIHAKVRSESAVPSGSPG